VIPRIREVHIRNYRSIERAVVPLTGFTVLVGPNGAGKTNFVDALAFVQECLSSSVEAALRSRGGILRIKTGNLPPWGNGAGFRLLVELTPDTVADYAFEIVLRREGNIEVLEERCIISVDGKEKVRFEVRAGQFDTPIPGLRASIEPNRLALYAASAVEEFRPLYDFLTGIRVYAIQPEALREPRDPSSGLSLEREGGNAAAVLRHVAEHHADRYERLIALLTTVVPGIQHVEGATIGGMQFLLFGENRGSAEEPLTLFPSNMSDGTLRMLGLLLAVYQSTTPTVLMIEEPEATIHPAAVDVVMSVMLDAAKRSQVIVTTHSPDVLDYGSLPDGAIRVVAKTGQGTAIAPVANSSREAIRDHLYSPGELLRSDELNPDVAAAELLSRKDELFGAPVHTFGGVD
jgi:predicted ATPase